MTMTKEQIDKAREMREEGLSYRKIGIALDTGTSTVRRWLSPVAQEYDKEYERTHKAERAQYHAVYHEAHKAERAAHRDAHKVEIAHCVAAYRDAHKVEIAQYAAAYYEDHKAEMAQKHSKYRRTHRAQCNAYSAKYRALIAGAILGATVEQKAGIAEIYRRAKEDKKVRCYLCGRLIPKDHRHVDHIVPLNKGGAHRSSNLAVACDKCNQSKQDKSPEEIGLLL